ncbi:MAG: efflux RND transporter periplasmic adaptor subunit [Gammaproteobacteria bacterium]|nr:efflux RND transporter periplasmic adaptor subunit [Gammaproteobacteria bacterium]MDE0224295.1 efflux RND transporter periplasmic adaptor subunit [Gammaproteobacteria bacterium]
MATETEETATLTGVDPVSSAGAGRASRFRRFLRRRWWLAIIAVLGVSAGGWWLAARDAADGAPPPLLAEVVRGDIENAVTAGGTIKPSTIVEVGAQASGQLEKVHVVVGQIVAEGDLLAEIDATVQINKVEQARAGLRATEAQRAATESSLTLAKANAARQERLLAAEATSQAEYDSAMNALVSARTRLVVLELEIEQSRASLASDEAELGYTSIYAPISGTVVSIERSEGETLNVSQQTPTILRVADLSTMSVHAGVSEADVGKLEIGTPVYFTTLGSGERRWQGAVRQISPTPKTENNVVLYPVIFDVSNDDGALLPDMTAQVFFVVSAVRDVLKVPVGALRDMRDGTASVRVVGGDGTAEERTVRLGMVSRISAEVVSGLEAGEQVVAGIAEEQSWSRRGPAGRVIAF